jgi:serine/threonine-protein kinase
MDTDRNLLFAVLALQSQLIDRDQFIHACSLWATRKDVPIAEVMVEQGWLMPAARGLVDQLLALNLAKHNGDVGASLAAAAGFEARGALASVADADVERSLAALPVPAADPYATVPPTEEPVGRNILFEEIGRGGMGRVLRGRDNDLRRELAVKVLLEQHSGDADVERRFIEEAQIGGQLQHPGVVPVYELGRFPDRRPFFTMKLVKGRTLAELLKERPDVGHDQARFLTIFEQVCQAVAYAHSKGVIHRDLKPGNVMVGAFGEVQVMDWGLAKVLARPNRGATTTAGEPSVLTARAGAAWDGRTGVIGTPAFMPPEQARGEAEAVDERADVFGLGGILCAILTGKPPYIAAKHEDVMRMASEGDVAEAFARLDGCGADAELVALCRECLAPRREERPREAGQVAARMASYAETVRQRLHAAELKRAAAEARADEAKAKVAAERTVRRRTRALAAAVLALVLVGAGAGLFVQHQAAAKRQLVESALEQATTMRDRLRFGEAEIMLGQGRKALGEGGPSDLRQRLVAAETQLALVKRLDRIRQRRATVIKGNFDNKTAESDYAAAFREAHLGEVGDDEAAVAARVRDSGVSGPLVAALDDWYVVTGEPSRTWLLGVARLADPDPWRDRFRDPAVRGDHKALRALADEALRDDGKELGQLSPQALDALGELLGRGADAVPLLRAAQRRYPDDFWLSLHLGSALERTNHYDEALGYCLVAVALRSDSSGARNNLGIALAEQGDMDGAAAELRRAIDLDHDSTLAYRNLGGVLRIKNDVEGAIAAYRQAIARNPDDTFNHNSLAAVLRDKGDLEGAVAEFRRATELDPKDGGALYNLGNVLHLKGDLDEAKDAYDKVIALDPEYAPAHNNLGNILRAKEDLNGAAAEYRAALNIDPKLAPAHNNLGSILRIQKNVDGAIAEFRMAIESDPNLAKAHYNLGVALQDNKDLEGAITEYRLAIKCDPKDAHACNNLGNALCLQGKLEEAIVEYRRAIEADPDYALAHFNLGVALGTKGEINESIPEFRQAIKCDPDYAQAHGALGEALLRQGHFVEARTETRRSLELFAPGDQMRQVTTQLLQECERLVALDEKLSAVLRGRAEPADTDERIDLARFCVQYKRRRVAAARFYAEAFAADPNLVPHLQGWHRYNAARNSALAAAGQAEDAENLPDKVKLMLRRQTLRWLREDLAMYATFADRADPAPKQAIRERLADWRQVASLASVREKAALDRIPDDERKEWQQLWNDVSVLLKKVEEKK